MKYNKGAAFLKHMGIKVHKKTSQEERQITFNYYAKWGEMSGNQEEEKAKEDEAKKLFAEEPMPWLVPACKEKMLKDKIAALGKDYFDVHDVAGLVPGVVNARMDARAIRWNDEKPDWEFEFRARAVSYSVDAAMEDLRKKMTAKVKHPETGKPTGEVVQKESHGMLIAITNAVKSRCEYCLVKLNEKNYFRVVVLIGNADA